MTRLQTALTALPLDRASALLVGRVWSPQHDGPSVVRLEGDRVIDITEAFPTMSDLVEAVAAASTAAAAGTAAAAAAGSAAAAATVAAAPGDDLGSIDDLLANTLDETRDEARPWLLSPIDLQAVKAAGVTFAVSMIERLIEERASGDPALSEKIRTEVTGIIGGTLADLVPGSPQSVEVKAALQEAGMWSQYLEVGIGPDAEIFTKAQPLSTVGSSSKVGVLAKSVWNNPEPEIGLLVASDGSIVGATLANDVNLRDLEGRSALLLSKAKDNNASASLGPFIRLFDDTFTLDSVRSARVDLEVVGLDGFRMTGSSSHAEISRDPADLVHQLLGAHHQYPDGAVLLLGTMFAPVTDRDTPGEGFTHKRGDVVTISSPELGSLVNEVEHSELCAPWTVGIRDLMARLSRRGVLGAQELRAQEPGAQELERSAIS